MDLIWLGALATFFAGSAMLVRVLDRLHREG